MKIKNMIRQHLLLVIAAIVVVLLPLFIRDPFIIHSIIMVFFMGYLGMSWNLMAGLAGQFSLGHCAFFGLGAYTSTVLLCDLNLTPLIGMIAGGFVAALASLFVGYASLRLKGHYFALATLAFSQVVRVSFINLQEVFGLKINGARGLLLPLFGDSPFMLQFISKTGFYYYIVILLVIILIVTRVVMQSRLGYYLKATKDEEQAAQCAGIDTTSAKVAVGAISAFFMALGGTFYAQLLHYIDPAVYNLNWTVETLAVAIIGGIGTLFGPLLGAILLVPLGEVTRIYLGSNLAGLHLVVYGVVIVVVMLFLPKGIISLFDPKNWRKRKGDRFHESNLDSK